MNPVKGIVARVRARLPWSPSRLPPMVTGVMIGILGWFLRSFPNYCPVWHTLNRLLMGTYRYADALTSLQRTVANGCVTAQVHAYLAVVYRHSQRLIAAEKSMRSALEREPGNANWWTELGVILSLRQQRNPALQAFAKAIALQPDAVEALFHLARLHLEVGFFNARVSEEYSRRALQVDPNHLGCLSSRAYALGLLGKLQEAALLHKKILTLSPNNAYALEDLLSMDCLSQGHKGEELQFTMTGMVPVDQAKSHFALAKIHMKKKDIDQAFASYQQGNRIMRQSFFYAIDQDAMNAQRVQTVFDQRFFSDRAGWGDPADKPIFIVGMPRSGTTLVEQILAAHPLCHGGGERFEVFELANTMGTLSRTHLAYPEATRELTREEVRILGHSCVQSLTLLNPSAIRITDKLPHNFHYVGLIHLLMPNARIIHCRRHPLDTCLSCFQQLFAGHIPYAYDLEELGRYYRIYHHLMQHWQQTLPGRMLDIHYEQVVDDLEMMVGRILDYCGLPWHADCLNFHQVERQVDTASFIEVRQPLYRTSAGRWKVFAEHLQPLRHALGDVLEGAEGY